MPGKVVPFARDSEYWTRRAKDNRRAGRWLDALSLQRLAIERGAGYEAHLELARMLFEMDCHALSNRVLAGLVTNGDTSDECYFALSRNYMAMGQSDRAYCMLMQYLSREPAGLAREDVNDLLGELVALKIQEEQTASARRIRRSDKLAEAARSRASCGAISVARELFLRALQARRGQDAGGICSELACVLASMGDMPGAVRMMKRAVNTMPVSSRILCRAAHVYAEAGCMGLARESVRRLEALGPEGEELDLLLDAYCSAADHKSVYDLACRLLKERPFDKKLLSDLAVSCIHTGRGGEARKLWNRILCIDPDDVAAQWALNHTDDSQRGMAYGGVLPPDQTAEWKEKLARTVWMSRDELKGALNGQLRMILRWALYGSDRQTMLLAYEILRRTDDPACLKLLKESRAEANLPEAEAGRDFLTQPDRIRIPAYLRRVVKNAVMAVRSGNEKDWQGKTERIIRTVFMYIAKGGAPLPRDIRSVTAGLYACAFDGEDGAGQASALYRIPERRIRHMVRLLTRKKETKENHESD